MKKSILTIALLATIANLSYAADCLIKTTRTACAGKEEQSFSQCDGQRACAKTETVTSPEACKQAALNACANDQLDITKRKEINVNYDGSPMYGSSGQSDMCTEYGNRQREFNQCAEDKKQ